MTSNQLLLATTAITMLGSMSHAQDVSYRQLGQLMTVTGGSDQAAFALGPEWSEELGFSATGRVGFTLGEGAAVGFIGELGKNVTEGMVNLGFSLPNNTSMILTAGRLRERLAIGDTGNREWVEQDEYGLAIKPENIAFNAYYVDSTSTDNFTGALTYGAEIEASTDLADNATLAASLGYQRIEWDGDTFEALDELTGSLDLAVAVTDTFRFNTFADYNVSEAQAGIGASWAIGAGSLDVDYTYVQMDNRSGLADDHRVGLTFSMPLGGGVSVASRRSILPGSVTASTQNANRGAGLLAEVMRRPEFLPERVVSAVSVANVAACDPSEFLVGEASYVGVWENINRDGDGATIGAYIATNDAGDYGVYDFYFDDGSGLVPVIGGSGVEISQARYEYLSEGDWLYAHYLVNGDNSIYAVPSSGPDCELLLWEGD